MPMTELFARFGLIEAYWNVNFHEDVNPSLLLDGLIEAYWNVNCYVMFHNFHHCNGLIEAYWNVNSDGLYISKLINKRFNRSILKCKWTSGGHFVCIRD